LALHLLVVILFLFACDDSIVVCILAFQARGPVHSRNKICFRSLESRLWGSRPKRFLLVYILLCLDENFFLCPLNINSSGGGMEGVCVCVCVARGNQKTTENISDVPPIRALHDHPGLKNVALCSLKSDFENIRDSTLTLQLNWWPKLCNQFGRYRWIPGLFRKAEWSPSSIYDTQ